MTTQSLSPAAPSIVLAEGRHAVLSRPESATAAPGVPVVVVMPLTEQEHPRAFADEPRLTASLSAASHPVTYVSWRNLWEPNGKERFTPRVNDLTTLLTTAGSPFQRIHLASIGNGALVALKWLSTIAGLDASDKPHVDSLTLIAPELTVFDRSPRTPLRDAPVHTCIVADESCDWNSTAILANRLPTMPQFALAEGNKRFLLSDDNRAPEDHLLTNAAAFEGDWHLSLADWLRRVHHEQRA